MAAALKERILMTQAEAAKRLGISDKLFQQEIEAQRIRFVAVGKRRRFTDADLAEYLDKQRTVAPCPSTSAKPRRSGGTSSSSRVIGFEEVRAKYRAQKHEQSKQRAAPRP